MSDNFIIYIINVNKLFASVDISFSFHTIFTKLVKEQHCQKMLYD